MRSSRPGEPPVPIDRYIALIWQPNGSLIAVSVPFTVVMVLVVSISMSVAVLPPVIVAMSILRHVFVVVSIIAHEIDGAAAGVVLRAMLAPVLLMSRRDMQVDGLRWNVLRRARNDDRLCIDHWRGRNIANVDLTVKAWLADADGYADISGKGRDSTYTQQRGK